MWIVCISMRQEALCRPAAVVILASCRPGPGRRRCACAVVQPRLGAWRLPGPVPWQGRPSCAAEQSPCASPCDQLRSSDPLFHTTRSAVNSYTWDEHTQHSTRNLGILVYYVIIIVGHFGERVRQGTTCTDLTTTASGFSGRWVARWCSG